ncbi:DEAD/DEAH box helicase [Maricaulis sp.]|uniref:DEAD/DEAH box helicase n=1 Tax=unclassified Maricaulis TaxID=2632371 RepID=UPI0025C41994|nr:DEAD/DEAH box helicase [Maricaulis sp.]
MTHFHDLGLAKPLIKAIDASGYTTPTPIQARAIPKLLTGSDLVGIAQTGTGKTAAFTLPLLHQLLDYDEPVGARRCRALVLAPTRELAAQIEENAARYAQNTKLRLTTVFGGVKPRPQIKALEPGVDMLIATPGRLMDHISTGALRIDRVDMVVLDEADQMLDLGFMPTIRQLMAKLTRKRQTVLFSATMPKQIRKLAEDFLTRPVEVSVAPQSTPIERIEQDVQLLERSEKRAALRDLLAPREMERAIVFTRTKHGANRVVSNLEKDGLKAVAIHGNKSQNQREKALAAFREGSVRILVATDIAARGIDIPGVSHVINFDLPNVPEAYVHRIGRTARAGTDGVAISLVEPGDRILLRDIEKLIGRHLSAFGAELEIPKDAKRPGSGGGGGGKRGGGGGGGGNRRRRPAGNQAKSGGDKPRQGNGKPGGKPKAKPASGESGQSKPAGAGQGRRRVRRRKSNATRVGS